MVTARQSHDLTDSPFNKKQAGTGPSRRHIQGSKIAKQFASVNLQYSKTKIEKKWTEWRAEAR